MSELISWIIRCSRRANRFTLLLMLDLKLRVDIVFVFVQDLLSFRRERSSRDPMSSINSLPSLDSSSQSSFWIFVTRSILGGGGEKLYGSINNFSLGSASVSSTTILDSFFLTLLYLVSTYSSIICGYFLFLSFFGAIIYLPPSPLSKLTLQNAMRREIKNRENRSNMHRIDSSITPLVTCWPSSQTLV